VTAGSSPDPTSVRGNGNRVYQEANGGAWVASKVGTLVSGDVWSCPGCIWEPEIALGAAVWLATGAMTICSANKRLSADRTILMRSILTISL